jgi:hypothetical protein
MDETAYTSQEKPRKTTPDVYEQMYALLYAYRFGTIGFLELLAAFEEILRVHTPQSNTRSDAA